MTEEQEEAAANRPIREEVCKWIGILAIAAGIMFLICSILTFITWCWRQPR